MFARLRHQIASCVGCPREHGRDRQARIQETVQQILKEPHGSPLLLAIDGLLRVYHDTVLPPLRQTPHAAGSSPRANPLTFCPTPPAIFRYSSSVKAFTVCVRTLPCEPSHKRCLASVSSLGTSTMANMSYIPMVR